MRRRVAAILLFALGAGGCAPETEPSAPAGSDAATLDSIIAQNTAALGGRAALDAIDNMVKHSRIVEGDDPVEAIFATDREGRMRVDIYAGGERVFAESYDGEAGHQWRPGDGQSAASARGTIALSHTPQLPNHIFRLKDLEANGHRLRRIGSDSIDGVSYSILRLTLSDGEETWLWFDHDSGWVTRSRNERALHVDIDSEERVIEARVSDFRPVGEIVHPHRVEEVDLATGEVLVRIELRELETNVALPDGYFRNLERVLPAPGQ